jgi:hypothetical protein
MAVSTPHGKAAEPSEAPGNGAIPPLKDGDRLSRAEFERRYMAMPDLVNAGFALVQQGLRCPENVDFVARLEQARIA